MGTKQTLDSMLSLVQKLVSVSEELLLVSRTSTAEKHLLPLQQQQQQIIADIVACDKTLTAKKDFEGDPVWESICSHLDRFETLNKSFIDTLTVKKGLVQFELHELREQRADLRKIKAAYITETPTRKDSKGSFDTVS